MSQTIVARAKFRFGDMMERSLWTGVQVTIGALPASLGVISQSGVLQTVDGTVGVGKAAAATGISATIAALLSLLKNLVSESKPVTAKSNLLLRFAWTFVFAAVATLPTAEIFLDLPFAHTVLMTALSAGIASVVSLAKNLTAEGVILETAKRAQLRVNVGTRKPIG